MNLNNNLKQALNVSTTWVLFKLNNAQNQQFDFWDILRLNKITPTKQLTPSGSGSYVC